MRFRKIPRPLDVAELAQERFALGSIFFRASGDPRTPRLIEARKRPRHTCRLKLGDREKLITAIGAARATFDATRVKAFIATKLGVDKLANVDKLPI